MGAGACAGYPAVVPIRPTVALAATTRSFPVSHTSWRGRTTAPLMNGGIGMPRVGVRGSTAGRVANVTAACDRRSPGTCDTEVMTSIRANSILPARRENMQLETADGLSLVAELSLPQERDPVATILCFHPLPTHGGMMDSQIFRKAAWRLPALADVAVLRFNTRGTSSVQGTSDGEFDNAVGERFDVIAAIEAAEFADLPNVWLVGWSFGTDLVLKYGRDPLISGTILLSPPLRYTSETELAAWADDGRPMTALVPGRDDYLRPEAAKEKFSVVPHANVIGVDRAKHLWVGDAELVLDEIVKLVNPPAHPLPTEWDGSMEAGDSSAYADRTLSAFSDVEVPGPQQRRV